MAATFGGEEGRLSVGIDVVMSPATITAATASVTLTWYVYARATYAFRDPQVMTLSNTLSSTKNYTMNSDNYETTTLYVGSWSQTISTSYSATVTRTLVAGASNLFNGGTPSHSRSIVIPKRPPQVPSAPLSADVDLTSQTTATVTWDRTTNYNAASNIWTNVIVMRSVNGGTLAAYATLAGTATSFNDTGLAVGSTYAYAVYSKNVTGSSAAASAGNVVTSMPTPTAVTPAAGSTVTKPNPTLGATLASLGTGYTTKAQWQFATNNTFTLNVRTVTESHGDFRTSGVTTELPWLAALSLFNGVWFVRARQLGSDGSQGPYSAAQSFTVNTPVLPTPTTVIPAAAAAVTTMQPTLGLTLLADTPGRLQKGEWQLATNSGFTANVKTITEPDSDFRASGATTHVLDLEDRITVNLGTTWYIRGRSAGEDGSFSAWTAGTSFTLSVVAPPVPTNILPITGGAVVTTNTPTLGATLVVPAEARLVKAEWQLATNTAFTLNVRTVTEGVSDFRSSGATTEIVPVDSKIFQGTWYVRARQIDEFGQAGAYSGYTTIVVAHEPSAIPSAPKAAITSQYAATTQFSWIFSDSSSTDTQSAYQIVVEQNVSGALVLDTGKINSTVRSGSHAIPVGMKDVQLRWKIRLWDSDNVPGPYADYSVFTLSDIPTVTITAPTNNQVLSTGQPTFTYTTDVGTTQVSRRIVVTRVVDGVVVFDSGTINTTSKTFTAPYTILQNTFSYSATITVTDIHGMVGTATRLFSASYSSPDAVAITVDETGYDESGYVYVDWSGTSPDQFFVEWRVYRRLILATDWELIFSTTDASVRFYNDWTVSSGDEWEYAVTQTGGRFGIVLESPIAQTETRLVEGTHYWMINPFNEADNIRLHNVTGDSLNDEYDEEQMVIIGRGRKVNIGTHVGYSGTLNLQLRDDVFGTARSKRIKIQLLKSAKTSYLLRNPFGDLLKVSMGNISIDRIPGVGTAEFVDVSIPYVEVF